MNKIGLVLLAAGSGTRMDADKNKVLLNIDGKPMFLKALQAFIASDVISDYVIVANPQEADELNAHLNILNISYTVTLGGNERQDSVYNGLLALKDEITYVMVHDGARPFIAPHTIAACAKCLIKHGSAVVGVYSNDTVKHVQNGVITKTLDRTQLINIQTPQSFKKEMLLAAHKHAQATGYLGTDDSVLVEKLGVPVHFVKGEYANKKVTTKADLKQEEKAMKIGHGMDVHAFAEGRKLILGGVTIPHPMGLLGHSDADVLTHAIMDGLLGAAGLADIGQLFPDTDPRYKDANSIHLLKKVGDLLSQKGFSIVNIDATLALQAPKIGQYINDMRYQLALALNINTSAVNVKATTTEKLGFVGRKQGAVCHAVCLLNHI